MKCRHEEFEKDICGGACPKRLWISVWRFDTSDATTNMSTAAIQFASTVITFAKLNTSDAFNFLS